MNIGATQQLAIENEALKAENKSIQTRLAALEQEIEDLRKHI